MRLIASAKSNVNQAVVHPGADAINRVPTVFANFDTPSYSENQEIVWPSIYILINGLRCYGVEKPGVFWSRGQKAVSLHIKLVGNVVGR